MATFHLEVELAGAAFDDPYAGPAPELQLLLDNVRANLEQWPDVQAGRLVDHNGNGCGNWWIEEGDGDE